VSKKSIAANKTHS